MKRAKEAEAPEWPEFMTVAEVAVILRVAKMTVYRLVGNKTLASKRVGGSIRIYTDSLREYLKPSPR